MKQKIDPRNEDTLQTKDLIKHLHLKDKGLVRGRCWERERALKTIYSKIEKSKSSWERERALKTIYSKIEKSKNKFFVN